mmetsp:Transcript_145330/g.464402  ORF Transcript_145330/g.464402 Transcript_145330/m.464402 type:complete len:310 (-) Transcript_145330:4268-5197(-)
MVLAQIGCHRLDWDYGPEVLEDELSGGVLAGCRHLPIPGLVEGLDGLHRVRNHHLGHPCADGRPRGAQAPILADLRHRCGCNGLLGPRRRHAVLRLELRRRPRLHLSGGLRRGLQGGGEDGEHRDAEVRGWLPRRRLVQRHGHGGPRGRLLLGERHPGSGTGHRRPARRHDVSHCRADLAAEGSGGGRHDPRVRKLHGSELAVVVAHGRGRQRQGGREQRYLGVSDEVRQWQLRAPASLPVALRGALPVPARAVDRADRHLEKQHRLVFQVRLVGISGGLAASLRCVQHLPVVRQRLDDGVPLLLGVLG